MTVITDRARCMLVTLVEMAHMGPQEVLHVPSDNEFFFFQAEDGIRVDLVPGVQTCALPILFDAIHASPPCQDHSRLRHTQPKHGTGWLLAVTVERLSALSFPWVIENVDGSGLPSQEEDRKSVV